MPNPVLVTGGAGFIGSNLVRYLINHTKQHVVNVDKLTYAGNLASLADISDSPRYLFEQVDIVDYQQLKAVFDRYQPQAIMHLAAESHVDRSIDAPGDFIQTNIVGTYNLLDISLKYYQSLDDEKKKLFRFHHVSTDEVYGSLESDDPAFSETTRYDPHSPYSASKASSDHLVRAWGDTFGLPVLITNCSNNYGPYQFPEKLIPVLTSKAISGQPIPVYGQGENIRDWLYVEDHVRAIEQVLTKGTVGSTYNIGGNNEKTNIELVRILCSILDELLPVQDNEALQRTNPAITHYSDLITFVEDRPGHDLRYAIDASKIQNELGWSPQEESESGFRKTVQWYLANRQWTEDILSGDYKINRQGLGTPECR